jgi:hypothetical protein
MGGGGRGSGGGGGGFGSSFGGGFGGGGSSGIRDEDDTPSFLSPGWLQRLNRPYLQGSGLSAMLPSNGVGILGGGGDFDDSGDEFLDDDSIEERDHDEEMANGSTNSNSRSGGWAGARGDPVRLHAPPSRDPASSLRAQLEALDQRDRDFAYGGAAGSASSAASFARFISLLGDEGDHELSSEDGDHDHHGHNHNHVYNHGTVEEIDDDDDNNEESSKYGAEPYNPLKPRVPKVIGAPLVPPPDDALKLLSASPTASLGSQAPQSLQGEAPPPPKLSTSGPIKQAKSTPDGDAPSGALKVEGFMDSSESPMKM